jgi:hypothetical protein
VTIHEGGPEPNDSPHANGGNRRIRDVEVGIGERP